MVPDRGIEPRYAAPQTAVLAIELNRAMTLS